MRKIEIRPAVLEDCGGLALLASSNPYSAPWGKVGFESELKNDFSRIYCAFCDGKLCGFMAFRFCFSSAELTNLAISSDFLRIGVASTLLAYGAEAARRENVTEITLEVNEKNTPAVNLYSKFLFKTVNIRKKFYNNTDNALLMLRKL